MKTREPSARIRFIVGGDGILGRPLLDRHREARLPVVATTRRPSGALGDWIWLDLAADLSDWQPPSAIGAAYLLAAITSQAACHADPEGAHRVNVENTVLVARRLRAAGAHVVFASTNQVFDGTRPLCRAHEPTAPLTTYGRLKAVAEERLLALGGGVAVIRFARVIDPANKMLRDWIAHLTAGRQITPFSDAVIAPVPLALAVESLYRLGEGRRAGLYRLSATADASYADIAGHFAQRLGADPALVRPTTTAAVGWEGEPFPQHTTLDSTALTLAVGVQPPNPMEAIDMTFFGPQEC